jgi:hypothetical protein
MSASQVQFSMDVSRYVEIVSSFPVSVVNVPSDKRLNIYPSTVTVTLRTAFPLTEDPVEASAFYVDYNDFLASRNGKCPVYISRRPKGLISYEVEPAMLECVLEEKL